MAFGLNLPKIAEPRINLSSDSLGEFSREIETVLRIPLKTESLTINGAITQAATHETERFMRNSYNQQELKSLVLQKIVSGLKTIKYSSVSLFEEIVVGSMELLDPSNMKRFFQGTTCLREKSDYFPKGFPFKLRQTAEAIIVAKLKDSIGEREVRDFLITDFRNRSLEKIKRDISFARQFGVNEVNFASLMFEIGRLASTSPVREKDLRMAIVQGMKGGKLDLVHVKCLRFVYLKGGGIEILTNTDDVLVEGVRGKYQPKSEKRLFERLLAIRSLLMAKGIREMELTVLVADEDIDLLYPQNNPYISEELKVKAKNNAVAYVKFLDTRYGLTIKIQFLSEYIANRSLSLSYQRRRLEVLEDLGKGEGKIVNPSFFEVNRVGHQFEYYQRLLGPTYSRIEARRSVSEQLASVIALEEIFKSFPKSMFVVEEDRGGENKLIGNGKYPIFFTTLRDEANFN